jgi:ABC-2 type transport system permease protein
MKKIYYLLKKEFREIFRDKRMVGVLIVVPFMQIIFFGYAVNLDIKNVDTAVIDYDKSSLSRELIEKIMANPYFHLRYITIDENFVTELFKKNKISAAIRIPLGFKRDIMEGKVRKIQIIADGTDANTATVALSYMRGIISSLEGYEPKIKLRIWYNQDLNSTDYILPGIVGMIVFVITTGLTALSIVKEKEKGTFESLIVTPLKKIEIIMAKIIPFAVIGYMEVALVLAVSLLWFKIPFKGNIFILIIMIALFLTNTLGLGLLISVISYTERQAILTALLIILPSVLLSGLMFPIDFMPEPFKSITYIIPLRYFIEIVRSIFLQGEGFIFIKWEIIPLLIGGITFISIGIVKFRKEI